MSEPRAEPGVVGEQAKQASQSGDIPRRIEEPGLPLDEDLRGSARPGSYDGQPGGHALKHDLAEGLRNN